MKTQAVWAVFVARQSTAEYSGFLPSGRVLRVLALLVATRATELGAGFRG